MRAKCVRGHCQTLRAQDSATEERSNRASHPIVKFPRVSPSEPSFDHRNEGVNQSREGTMRESRVSQRAGSDASP